MLLIYVVDVFVVRLGVYLACKLIAFNVMVSRMWFYAYSKVAASIDTRKKTISEIRLRCFECTKTSSPSQSRC